MYPKRAEYQCDSNPRCGGGPVKLVSLDSQVRREVAFSEVSDLSILKEAQRELEVKGK